MIAVAAGSCLANSEPEAVSKAAISGTPRPPRVLPISLQVSTTTHQLTPSWQPMAHSRLPMGCQTPLQGRLQLLQPPVSRLMVLKLTARRRSPSERPTTRRLPPEPVAAMRTLLAATTGRLHLSPQARQRSLTEPLHRPTWQQPKEQVARLIYDSPCCVMCSSPLVTHVSGK